MATDALKELFYKTSFTLKGRIFHPNLTQPRTKTNATTGKTREVFDVMFAWNPADPANAQAMQHLLGFMNQMSGQCFPGVDPRALVIPIKASHVQGWPEYQRNDYKPNADYLHGHHWINAETGKDMPPTVVNQQRQAVISDAEIYSGRNAVCNFQLYPMLMDPTNRQKKIGFGVNLNAIMLLEGGEREGGRATVDVNSVFGGFAQDMGMAPQFGNFGQPAAPAAPAAPAYPAAPAPAAPMGNYPAPGMPTAPAANGPTQYPQMPTAPAAAPAQPYAPTAYPSSLPPVPGQAPAPAAPAQGGFPAYPNNFAPNGR